MASSSSSLPSEKQSDHGNIKSAEQGQLSVYARNNTSTRYTSNCLTSTTLNTAATTPRYYIFIIMVSIPVLSWNLSMQNLWSEMSAVEEMLYLEQEAASKDQIITINNNSIIPITNVLDQYNKINKNEEETAAAAPAPLFDIQYMELPNGISATIKKGSTTMLRPNKIKQAQQSHPVYNNMNNKPQQRPNQRAKTVSIANTTLHPHHISNNRNIRIRLSPQGDIDIKDPNDTIRSNHLSHDHDNKSTNTTTTTNNTILL